MEDKAVGGSMFRVWIREMRDLPEKTGNITRAKRRTEGHFPTKNESYIENPERPSNVGHGPKWLKRKK